MTSTPHHRSISAVSFDGIAERACELAGERVAAMVEVLDLTFADLRRYVPLAMKYGMSRHSFKPERELVALWLVAEQARDCALPVVSSLCAKMLIFENAWLDSADAINARCRFTGHYPYWWNERELTRLILRERPHGEDMLRDACARLRELNDDARRAESAYRKLTAALTAHQTRRTDGRKRTGLPRRDSTDGRGVSVSTAHRASWRRSA